MESVHFLGTRICSAARHEEEVHQVVSDELPPIASVEDLSKYISRCELYDRLMHEDITHEDLETFIERHYATFDVVAMRKVIGFANAFKHGDLAIGVGVSDQTLDDRTVRRRARTIIENTKLNYIRTHPVFEDKLFEAIAASVDESKWARVCDWTVAQLRQFLLDSSEDDIKDILDGLCSDVIACVIKIMSDKDIVAVSAKLFFPLPSSRVGARGYLAARIQPNSPTDDPEEITWQIFNGLAFGLHLLLIGTNPVDSTVASVGRVERTLQHVVQAFGLDGLVPWCVLSHCDVQAAVAAESGDSSLVPLMFQSLAGCDATNGTFGISVESMVRHVDSGQPGFYFETGQGSEFTNLADHGTDMVLYEARKYGFVRLLKHRMMEKQQNHPSQHNLPNRAHKHKHRHHHHHHHHQHHHKRDHHDPHKDDDPHDGDNGDNGQNELDSDHTEKPRSGAGDDAVLNDHYPWVHVNDVSGFIGPEVFRTREQLVRVCLEDLLMGKLHGLTMGLDICATLHMGISPSDLDWCQDHIAPACPAYIMALPTKSDPMLSYLTTAFQDHIRLREKFGFVIDEQFIRFYESIGIMNADGSFTEHAGDPYWVYYQYLQRTGDKRSYEEAVAAGKEIVARLQGRGIDLAIGHGERVHDLTDALHDRVQFLYDDAKKCLWAEFDEKFLDSLPHRHIVVATQSRSREEFIMHPSTGEQLTLPSTDRLTALRDSWTTKGSIPDIQIVVSDGLNANAIMDSGHLLPFLEELETQIRRRNWVASENVILVRHGRVRAGYAVGDILFENAPVDSHRAVVHVIGERPGTEHHNYSVYIAAPRAQVWRDHTCDHNIVKVVSGISDTAMEPRRAAEVTATLLDELWAS